VLAVNLAEIMDWTDMGMPQVSGRASVEGGSKRRRGESVAAV
jgi:hypothetical protein